MINLNLKSKLRELGNKGNLNAGRSEEQIPAVLYGFEQENSNLWVDGRSAEVLYKEVGKSRLLTLEVEGKDQVKVVIKEAQLDPVTDRIIHMDLYKVDLKKPIDIKIPIRIIGEAPAVKILGGTLITSLDRLEIRCLPEDILKDVEADLSTIETYDDTIHVSSLKLPENIEVLTNSDTVIAIVKPPRVEEKKPETAEETEGEEAKEGEKEGETEGESKDEAKKEDK
jgi:large subunit ribosomal protein L25